MIVSSGSPAPLKYTDPTYQASLFVRALIIDTSGGSPVLEGTVNLFQYLTSAVYFGKYTFTAGKTYLVIKNVYTDGTYATVDTGFSQDNDDFQCVDLKLASIDAAISSRASQASVDAIPTDTLLSSDSRLDALDADISSRASQTSLDNLITTIGTPAGASIAADIAAAGAPPAEIADAVWDALRATHQDAGSFGESNGLIIDGKMTVAINPATDTLQLVAWLESNGQMVTDPDEATALIYDGAGSLVLTLGPNSSPSAIGTFEMTSGSISQTLNQNFTYAVKVQITKGSDTYNSLRTFTVF